jgi:hypothetical protein
MNVVGVLLSVLLACLCACTALPQYGRSPDYSDDAPVVLCPNYPYCDDAPYRIPHLQVNTESIYIFIQSIPGGEQ